MPDRFTRILLVFLVLLAAAWVGQEFARTWLLVADEPRPVVARGSLSEAERTAVEVFEQVSPSVAFIVSEFSPAGILPGQPHPSGAGSGFVWDAAGHIVTNAHVIEGAERVGVRLGDELLEAEVVGSAPAYDLAVIRVPNGRVPFRPIAVGDSADLRVGQTAFALGNPFGLSRTLTQGIISALDRSLPTATLEIRGVIQTDAAVNPGNSGGPLLDSAGRLIGVNTAIISQTGAAAGIGFAIPVDVVNEVVPQLIEKGSVPRPGIGIAALPEELAARLPVDGVIVADVVAGSPAEKAALRGIAADRRELGDVITHVDGEPVRSVPELARKLAAAGIGGAAELTVWRNGQTRTVEVAIIDISQQS